LALLRQSLRRRRGEAFHARARGGKENGQDETPASAAARIPLPLLMPRHLTLLPCARAAWFENADELTRRLPALLAELRFLEQGAARLRVFRIEALAATLHELYVELMETPRPDFPRRPAPLLARAH